MNSGKLIALTAIFVTSVANAADSEVVVLNQAKIAAEAYEIKTEYNGAIVKWEHYKQARLKAEGLKRQDQDRFIRDEVKKTEDSLATFEPEKSTANKVAIWALKFVHLEDPYKAFLRSFNGKTFVPPLPQDYRRNQGVEIFKAAQDKLDPDHEFAAELAGQLGYVRGKNWRDQEDIRRFLNNKTIIDNQALFQKKLEGRTSKSEDQVLARAGKAELAEKAKRSADTLSDLVNWENSLMQWPGLSRDTILGKLATDEDKKKWARESFDGVAQFGAGLGALFRDSDPETAELFQKGAVAGRALGDFVEQTMTNSFANAPLGYVGVCMAVISSVASLADHSKEQQQEALMEALKRIMEMIVKLQEMMIARFDRLDISTRSYFEREMAGIDKSNWFSQQNNFAIKKIMKDIHNLHIEMNQGFHATQLPAEIEFTENCLKQGVDRDQVKKCRNYFGGMATLGTSSANGKPEISMEELKNLAVEMREVDSSQNISTDVHPSAWMLYAKNFLKLFRSNPYYKSLANQSVEDHQNWSLASMIEAGQKIQQNFKSLLVENGRLKKDVLEGLVARYEREAIDTINSGFQIMQNSAARGPNPFIGTDTPVPPNTKFSFEADNIDFCKDAPHVVQAPNITAAPAYPFAGRVDVDRLRREAATAFDPRWFRAMQVLPLIPNEVLWASILGETRDLRSSLDFGQVTVVPCFRTIKFPVFFLGGLGPISPDVQIHMELEIHVIMTYLKDDANNPKELEDNPKVLKTGTRLVQEDILVVAYSLDHRVNEGNFLWLSFVAGFPVHQIWNENHYRHEYGQGPTWEPVAKDPTKWFKKIEFPKGFDLKKLADFYWHVEDFMRLQRNDATRVMDKNYPKNSSNSLVKEVTMPSLRALKFAVQSGLDPAQPQVKDLLDFLATDSGLPDQRALAYGGMSNVDPKVEVHLLQARTKIARAKIAALAQIQGLHPRTDKIDQLLEGLRALQK